MRARLSGFVFVAVLLSTFVSAAERPPQDLRWTGDHWTAWSPPQPPEGAQTHVIQRGDTLWDLAAKANPNGDIRTTVDDIMRLNSIESAGGLQAGDTIAVPLYK